MYPLILIKSYGSEKFDDIVKEILRFNGEKFMEPIKICVGSYYLNAHKLSLSTKYYKTYVLMFDCEDINAVPNDVKSKIEGALFYFDSSDFNFLSELETLVKFVTENHIEVSTLITRNLSENNGIQYDVLKSRCKLDVNVIDLNVKMDIEDSVGYAAVLELLKNHVWSNVHIPINNSNRTFNMEENHVNAEEAVNEFEELLNKFQQFKDISQNLSRQEILQNAENLAELFENILNED